MVERRSVLCVAQTRRNRAYRLYCITMRIERCCWCMGCDMVKAYASSDTNNTTDTNNNSNNNNNSSSWHHRQNTLRAHRTAVWGIGCVHHRYSENTHTPSLSNVSFWNGNEHLCCRMFFRIVSWIGRPFTLCTLHTAHTRFSFSSFKWRKSILYLIVRSSFICWKRLDLFALLSVFHPALTLLLLFALSTSLLSFTQSAFVNLALRFLRYAHIYVQPDAFIHQFGLGAAFDRMILSSLCSVF